jgi:hypothetical protein
MAHNVFLKARVLADLALGMSVRGATRKHGVAHSTVLSGRDAAMAEGSFPVVSGRDSDRVDEDEPTNFGAMIEGYVVTGLRALQAQAEVFCDQDWLYRCHPPS